MSSSAFTRTRCAASSACRSASNLARSRSARIRAFRHLWGLETAAPQFSLAHFAQKGYAGVEAAIEEFPDPHDLREQAAAVGLAWKPLLELSGRTPEGQLVEYEELLDRALSLASDGITVHSGRDFWPRAEAVDFYRAVVRIERDRGVRGGHETHRGRALFSPWSARAILEAVPDLRVTCDFSHWVVVGERLLEDQIEPIEIAASRAVHLHARVGFDQGPQVPDPRLPESAEALSAHERWWELIWDAQMAAGAEVTTFAPEYGPRPYSPAGQSAAELEEICDWQAESVRAHFERWQRTRAERFEAL